MTQTPSDPWPGPIHRVAFLFAMSAEGTGFARRLGLKDQGKLDPALPAHWLSGRIPGDQGGSLEVAVGFAGTDPEHGVDRIGTISAALAAHLLIRRFEPDLLVNAGTCGGFKGRGAGVGSIYLGSKDFLFHDHRVPLAGFDAFGVGRIQARYPEELLGVLDAQPGVVSTGDSFTPCEEELAFFEREGVHAKEMEAAGMDVSKHGGDAYSFDSVDKRRFSQATDTPSGSASPASSMGGLMGLGGNGNKVV